MGFPLFTSETAFGPLGGLLVGETGFVILDVAY